MARVRRTPRLRRGRVNPVEWAFVNDEPMPEGANPFTWLNLETGISCRRERDRIRALWESLRDEVLHGWTRERPGTRPRLWWEFEAPHPRLDAEAEADYLERNGLLTPGEWRALGKARTG